MPRDLSLFLWLLKLGAPLNIWLIARSFELESAQVDPHIVEPARILFAVSAYRCLLPNRYAGNVVFHDNIGSSTFVTRVLATFSEVAYIYMFSHVLRLLNVDGTAWIDALSWLMVVAVCVSQCFVWGAILTGRLRLYFYEETGWAILFTANTLASAWLYATVSAEALAGRALLLQLNLAFGALYLPWQMFHLRALLEEASAAGEPGAQAAPGSLARRLRAAIHQRRASTLSEDWGGLIGLTWMTAYWATLIPLWVDRVVILAGARAG